MSLPRPRARLPVVVAAADAEYLAPIEHHLLADSSATGGALSTHRVRLSKGAAGATPHRHNNTSELFFLLEGVLQVLIDDRVITASQGDLVVVPPELDHAFAAHPNSGADTLIVITPGVERFEYLRQIARIRIGEASPDSLLTEQARYDTHFVDSPLWQATRSSDR